MVLETTGFPDFKHPVLSAELGDIVQISEDIGSAANKAFTKQGVKTTAVVGTAENFPSVVVPNGYTVVIKALSSNITAIHIANAKADAEADATAYELQPNEFLTIKITNLNILWLDVDTAGEGITYAVESDT